MIKMNVSDLVFFCFTFVAIGLVGLSSGTSCSSDFTDVSTCTFLSDVVFEGHPISPAGQTDPPRDVTFQVKKLHKGSLRQNDKNKFLPVSVGIFSDKENSSNCISGPVEPKTKYLVFLKDNNFTSADGESYRIACSLPVPANKKNSKEASNSARAKNGQKPTVKLSPAKEVKVTVGQNAQLSCNHQGNPPPRITWSKNGKSLIIDSRIQLKSAKRSTKLIIKKVTVDDQGFYECQAVNVLGASPKIGVRLTATIRPTTPPPTSHNTLCADQRMCFNNGTCFEVTQLGRKFCRCLSQFKGPRCQEKNAPEMGKSAPVTQDFLFVVVVGVSVAGVVLLAAALVALCASLKRHRKERKLSRQDQNLIVRHQDTSDNAEDARLLDRQDVSMQTDCSHSANDASPSRKRLLGSAPLPNGKVSVLGTGSTSVAPNISGSPHVSSSSSGTSPSEIDSAGEYFVESQSSVCSSRRGTPRSKPKGLKGGNKSRSSGRQNAEPPIEMKAIEETLLLEKTTRV